ncbi:MAG: class I SAM-dependent methyltransferase [Gaiellaceae bacterium]
MKRAHRSVQELDLSLQLRAEAALASLQPAPGARIGDLGCGTGCFSAELALRGYRVQCVDVTPANLDALRRMYPDLVERGLLTPIQGDLTALPLETSALDGAVCMEVLEHVEDDFAALGEIARVVRPGGVLTMSVPNRSAPLPLVERMGLDSVHDRPGPERHVRPGYDDDELAALISESGFRITAVHGVGGRLYRGIAGVVSLAHLAYRRGRGQQAWTWADLERDTTSLPVRAYAAVFPALLFLARLDRSRSRAKRSTLVVTATRV